jgi:Trypsin-like peptidase domain
MIGMLSRTSARLVIVLVALAACFHSAPVRSADFAPLFRKVSPSVVLVMAFDENDQPKALGSGFFVGDGRAIVTNFHVVERASSITVKMTSGETANIKRFLASDPLHDLVLLESPTAGAALSMSQKTPDVGQEVAAFGNPKGLEGTLSTGIVSGLRSDDKSWYIQITAPISPGSSGGPVVNLDGVVVGVASFYIGEGQNLNFAMPAGYVHKLLDGATPRPISTLLETPSTRPSPTRSQDLVRVVEGSLWRGEFIASVLNRTENTISNVLVLATYHAGYDRQSEEKLSLEDAKLLKEIRPTRKEYPHCSATPVHYQLFRINKTVPPRLALRFVGPKDTMLDFTWCYRAQVLDYEIKDADGPRIPTLQ